MAKFVLTTNQNNLPCIKTTCLVNNILLPLSKKSRINI